jgi:hypothetical protein
MPVITRSAAKRILSEKEETTTPKPPNRPIQYLQQPLFDNTIDFDGASKAWRANKKHVGQGCFIYKNG